MKPPHLFGLIGYPLSHSFSKKYFSQKFENEGVTDCRYDLFPLKKIEELPELVKVQPDLIGLNVTIPYKEAVFNYLDEIEEEAVEIGAVNTIKIENGILRGYNTDVFGFEQSLRNFLKLPTTKVQKPSLKALLLGTGGASKAVAYVLRKLGIDFQVVSRQSGKADLTYKELDEHLLKDYLLIVNTTPLGMSPNVEKCPAIPYEFLTDLHFLYDLVYNPEKTLFLKKGAEKGSRTCNGLEMLYLQAEKAWEIWNS
jgi:shikimate dehydrogenase